MIKIKYLPKNTKRISGVGRADYKKKIIYLRKGITPMQKKVTIAHEKAHFGLRRMGINRFPKKVVNELKNSPRYKSYIPEGYKRNKIPIEIFTDTYGALKSGEISKQTFKKSFAKKYPYSYKYFNKTFKRI